ncbi:hypothetical protein ACYSNO_10385 [Enterococcus sp. LJL98]
MNELSKIPPVQLPITTIASNITQTPQTPLDQKVALTKQEKAVVAKRKKTKKDQVAINEQHWTRLNERREIEVLRDLQIVVLFSQLLQQGLWHLQEGMAPILAQLSEKARKKASVRQSLTAEYQAMLRQVQQKNQPIEKQLTFIVEKGAHLIETHQGYWQIKNRQRTFPVQMMLATFLTEFATVTFPETAAAEKKLAQKAEELLEMQAHVTSEKQKVHAKQALFEQQRRQFTAAETQRKAQQEKCLYWERLLESKAIEQAHIQKKVQQMALVHPLKRKQQEYQAYVLRDQVIQKELTAAALEVKKANGIYRALENQAKHTQKIKQDTQKQVTNLEAALSQLQENYQQAAQKELALLQTVQAEFQSAYDNLQTRITQYVTDLHNEQTKTNQLEQYYRQQLESALATLKQKIKHAPQPFAQKVRASLQQELLDEQSATILTQANAESSKVQQLLEEK